ncbi:MAG: MMPL family transporter [Usitatibacter sp.]
MAARRAAIGLWLAGLALCAIEVSRATFVADLSSFLPSAPTAEQRLLVEQLREGAISRVMLIGIEGADSPTRARISRELAAALRADPGFISAANGASTGFERERDLLLAYRYVLSPNVAPGRFTVEGLRAAIGETVESLASPAGLMLKSLVPRDPTGELLSVLEQLRPPEGPRVADGVWTNADGSRALLIARTRASGSNIDAQARAVAAAEAAFAKIAGAGAARLVMTGPGVFSARARAMIEHDVERLAAISMLIVAAVLLLVYRSALALLLGLVPVVSGALAGFAAVSLGMGTVHGITLGFGTTLIGEAVDYSIYLFVQSERSEKTGDEAWIAGFWPTIRLGVLTSIAGFSALLFSGLPGLAQLGLYSISGLIAAAAVTRFVLPALLPARFRIRDVSPLGHHIASLAAVLSRGRWLVVAAALLAALVLLAHRDALWDPDISSLNPISQRDRILDRELRTAIGASDARHMIAVKGASADAALENAEAVGARLDELVAAGRLGGYESPARFLPSLAMQRARLESLPDAPTLRARLRQALAQSPLRAERLEPFVADVDRARAAGPLTREKVSGTALDIALDGLLFRDGNGRWNALLGLRAPAGQPLDLAAVRNATAAAGVEDAVFLDLKAEIDHLYAGYLDRAMLMSAVGLAIIVALLSASLRSPLRVARVMAPLVAGVLVVAAWHAFNDTRLSLLHLVGLLLVVAIGSNYALFFDRIAQRRDSATPRTLASLALANATTVASFGVLSLSSIPVLQSIGSTVAAGAFITLLFAAMLAQISPVRTSRE